MHDAHQTVFTWMTTHQPLVGGHPCATPMQHLVQSQPFAGKRAANMVFVGNDTASNTVKFCLWARQLLVLGVHVVVIEGRGERGDHAPYDRLAQWARDHDCATIIHARSDAVDVWDPSVQLTIYNGNPWFLHVNPSREYADYFCHLLDHLTYERTAVYDVWNCPPVVVIFDHVGTHPYALPATLARASAQWPQMNMHLWLDLPTVRFALTEPDNPLLEVWSRAAMIGIGSYHDAMFFNELQMFDRVACQAIDWMPSDELLLNIQGTWQAGTLDFAGTSAEVLVALSRAGHLLSRLARDDPYGALLMQWMISHRLVAGGNVREWVNQLEYVVQSQRTRAFQQRVRVCGTQLETIMRRELFPDDAHVSVVQRLFGRHMRYAPHVDIFNAWQ